MNSISVFAKFLDQPKLVAKFSKAVPAILIVGGGVYGYEHIKVQPEETKKQEIIRTITVLTATIISALMAPKITSKILKKHHHHEHIDAKKIIDNLTKTIEKITPTTKKILEKAKEKILLPNEIKTLFEEFKNIPQAKKLLSGKHGLIPEPEQIDSNHIFKEDVKRLSVLGLIPVLGGITGGIIGDKLTDKAWKNKIPDKLKEGSYQYLANIFLCNIGAGAALLAMEKLNIKSKSARILGMLAGIMLTGVAFGSAIANLIGKKVISPLINNKNKEGSLYDERIPELLDIGLHVDDIATVAVLSGLKWVEPALPVFYSISGYRAGIGYRNGKNIKNH